jgi:hypothetical protein
LIQNTYILVLLENGRCTLHSKQPKSKPAFINLNGQERVRSVFFNKLNDSIIIVSVMGEDNFNSLKCRSIKLDQLTRAYNVE